MCLCELCVCVLLECMCLFELSEYVFMYVS